VGREEADIEKSLPTHAEVDHRVVTNASATRSTTNNVR
jgi:hypothetical protein